MTSRIIKFKAKNVKDNGLLQCITGMKEYENKSLEEIRFEDYTERSYIESISRGSLIKKSKFEDCWESLITSTAVNIPQQDWILAESIQTHDNWFWTGHLVNPDYLNADRSASKNAEVENMQKEKSKMVAPTWAYQVENFIKAPDPELICSICQNVFRDPVQTPCEHVFCRHCITKWLENNDNCPNCRQQTTSYKLKSVIPLVKNIISNLQLSCHNFKRGCCSIFTVENCVAHVQTCPYELIRCDNKPCPEVFTRKNLDIHKKRMCAHGFLKYLPDKDSPVFI